MSQTQTQGEFLGTSTPVEVRCSFDGAWVAGFEIEGVAEVSDWGEPGYRLRRRSDGAVLPAIFRRDDIRGTSG